MDDRAVVHFGQWANVILWIVMMGLFLFFIPFYKKSQRRPASVYFAFIVAMAFEMFGVPMSMYILAWALGKLLPAGSIPAGLLPGGLLPDGILWGHTLYGQFGHLGMYVGTLVSLAGALLVILGWKEVYKRYWSKDEGNGQLVTDGIYAYIRHPQYTGFLMITLGMLLDWATLPMLIMWPILAVMYYKLAQREEREMEAEFGEAYRQYRGRSNMFLPLPRLAPAA